MNEHMIGGAKYRLMQYKGISFGQEKKLTALFKVQEHNGKLVMQCTDPETALKIILVDTNGNHPENIDDLKVGEIVDLIKNFTKDWQDYIASLGEPTEISPKPKEELGTSTNEAAI